MTTRRARLRTNHGDAATARRVARAVRPDNTPEMETEVEGATIATTIRRETTSGLHSTVDDYVVNLQVATRLAAQPADDADGATDGIDTEDTDTPTDNTDT